MKKLASLFLAFVFSFALCTTAFAVDKGQVSGESGLLYVKPMVLIGTFTTKETVASASDVEEIYVSGRIETYMHPGAILISCEKSDFGTTSIVDICTANGKNQTSYIAKGIHISYYTSGKSSVTTTTANYIADVFYSLPEPSGKQELWEDRAYQEFGVNLNELSFIPFDTLWNLNGDELPAEYEPLKLFLVDEYILSKDGEWSPAGVYYNESEAYIVRELQDGQIKLVHCQTSPSAAAYSAPLSETTIQDFEGRRFNGVNYTLLSTQLSAQA